VCGEERPDGFDYDLLALALNERLSDLDFEPAQA
jgi:hypothetical protein